MERRSCVMSWGFVFEGRNLALSASRLTVGQNLISLPSSVLDAPICAGWIPSLFVHVHRELGQFQPQSWKLNPNKQWRNNSFLGISSKAYQRRNSRNSPFPWRDLTWSGMKTSSTKWGKTCLSCGKSIIKKRLPLRQSNIEVTVSLRGVLGPVLYLIHTVDLSMNVHLLLLSLAMRYTFILRNTPR